MLQWPRLGTVLARGDTVCKGTLSCKCICGTLAPSYPETPHVVFSIVFYEQTYMLQHWDTQILPQLIPVTAINC